MLRNRSRCNTLVLALLLLLAGCASTPGDWSAADRKRAKAVYAAIALDTATTVQIQNYYPEVHEAAPVASRVLGPSPQTAETIIYMGTLAWFYRFTAKRLTPKWRKVFQYAVLSEHLRASYQGCTEGFC